MKSKDLNIFPSKMSSSHSPSLSPDSTPNKPTAPQQAVSPKIEAPDVKTQMPEIDNVLGDLNLAGVNSFSFEDLGREASVLEKDANGLQVAGCATQNTAVVRSMNTQKSQQMQLVRA